MRGSLLLAALLLPAAARAQDMGADVHFGARHGASFAVTAAPTSPGGSARVLFDSGDSDAIRGDWDTMLIHGVLPDPNVRFMALRPGGAQVWVELQVKRFPDGRFWAKGTFLRGAGAVRLRAVDAGVAVDHEVEVYGAEVYDASAAEAPAPAAPARGPVDPGAVPPLTHARSEWSAKPPKEPWTPDPMPWRITLHHSDGRYTQSLAESLAEAGFIQDFHQNGRGWNDIAYHYLVDPLGNVIEGRPLGMLGAHTLNNNEGNVGIVLLGTYHAPKNDQPTAAQLKAVADIGRFLVKRFGIDPATLKGHRDYKSTDCPGDLAYPRLSELRKAFAGGSQVVLAPVFEGQPAISSAAAPKATR